MREILAPLLAFVLSACSAASSPAAAPPPEEETPAVTAPRNDAPAATEVATFATGCFWCSEAVFQRLDGVIAVRSGFTGGSDGKPTYKDVCSGTTGHAEAVEVTFDPRRVTYATLLDWFWQMHDPTTLNRQGADVGTQYRSAIFWHGDAQRKAALASKTAAQDRFRDPIVTEIAEAGPFHEAETYHQDYYDGHSAEPYCRAVIAPKLSKLGLEKKR